MSANTAAKEVPSPRADNDDARLALVAAAKEKAEKAARALERKERDACHAATD